MQRRRRSAAPLGDGGTTFPALWRVGSVFGPPEMSEREFLASASQQTKSAPCLRGCRGNTEAQIRRFHFRRKYELIILPPVSTLAVARQHFC